jgi:hypothetical protein
MFTDTKIAVVVATVLGTAPAALAETPSKHLRHISSSAATARAMVHFNQVRQSRNPAFDVYDGRGHYLGSDPDPRIRMELLRDPRLGSE